MSEQATVTTGQVVATLVHKLMDTEMVLAMTIALLIDHIAAGQVESLDEDLRKEMQEHVIGWASENTERMDAVRQMSRIMHAAGDN